MELSSFGAGSLIWMSSLSQGCHTPESKGSQGCHTPMVSAQAEAKGSVKLCRHTVTSLGIRGRFC